MPTLWGEWEEAAARCSADADADAVDAAQEENGFDAAVDRGGDDASGEMEASPCVYLDERQLIDLTYVWKCMLPCTCTDVR
jgi:hypothetical protein